MDHRHPHSVIRVAQAAPTGVITAHSRIPIPGLRLAFKDTGQDGTAMGTQSSAVMSVELDQNKTNANGIRVSVKKSKISTK